MGLAALLGGTTAAEALGVDEPRAPGHRITVHITGAVAMIELERPLSFTAEPPRGADEVIVDLDLPDGARWIGAELEGLDGLKAPLTLRPQPRAATAPSSSPSSSSPSSSSSYARLMSTRGLRSAHVPVDDGVDVRLRVASAAVATRGRAHNATLRVRFVAPLRCEDGRFVLHVPGPVEADPPPADVRATIEPGAPDGVITDATLAGVPWRSKAARAITLAARAPARAAWQLAFALQPTARAAATELPALATRVSPSLHALLVCRPRPAARLEPPTHVLFLIDRSRSMGPAGISLARDVARALMEALPPSVSFNAIFFDRVSESLFPLPRAATREAVVALEEAATPGALKNGTNLPDALRRAGRLARRLPEASAATRTWWVLLTDGALPEDVDAAAIKGALEEIPTGRARAAVVVVRELGDERAAPRALEALAALPARWGGVVRPLESPDIAGAMRSLVSELQSGGDLVDVRASLAGAPSGARPAAGVRLIDASLAPGAGRLVWWRASSTSAAFVVRARWGATPVTTRVRSLALPPPWRPVVASPQTNDEAGEPPLPALVAETSSALARLEPIVEVVKGPRGPVGQMDREVVRNALSLAFLPRARACYLRRNVRNPGDLDLKGRLRLELHLERGEVMSAAVKQSTLARPDIEACLRDAAFAVEVPRALHRDAPVVAALNLVFQPRTPVKTAPEASAVSEEIDLILGPLPFSKSDPMELIRSSGSPGTGSP